MRRMIYTMLACLVLTLLIAGSGQAAQAIAPDQVNGIAAQMTSNPLITKVVSCRECARMQCRGLRIGCAPGCRCSDFRPGGGRGDSCRECAAKQCRGLRIACPRGCRCGDVFPSRR